VTPLWYVEVGGFLIPDIVFVTLALTLGLSLLSFLAARRLETRRLSLWQTGLEMFLGWIEDTIREVVDEDPRPYVPLIATLMIFIAVSNTLSAFPRLRPPTADLSTTTALALVVFVAVPIYGIRRNGLWAYLRQYAHPTPLLLPLNVMGELTRTVALAVRLFGNAMSGQMIGAILLLVAGFLVPLPLILLGLLTGLIQAYIFGILAAVFIAAAVEVQQPPPEGS
jgi:F-type H+-transporting ATPase subunit a